VVREGSKDGVKLFYCILYFPRQTHSFLIRKINPEQAHLNKRSAENHVALRAVKKLHKDGFLTENFLTNYNHAKVKDLLPPSEPKSTQSQAPPQMHQSADLSFAKTSQRQASQN